MLDEPKLPWHLQLGSKRLEAKFRSSLEYKRVALLANVGASASTLAVLVVVFSRWLHLHSLQGQHSPQINPAAPPDMAVLGSLAVRSAIVALPVLLAWLRPTAYRQLGQPLITFNRVMQLTNHVRQMLSCPRLGMLVPVVVHRALQASQPAARGLGVLLFHPSIFTLPAALFLVPWQWACVFQGVTAATYMLWVRHMLCMLPATLAGAAGEAATAAAAVTSSGGGRGLEIAAAGVAAAASQASSLAPAFLQPAQHACAVGQSAAAVLRGALGDPLSTFSAHICEGWTAVTVLQVFVVLACLLCLPVAGIYELERCLKLRFVKEQRLEQQRQQQQQQQEVQAGRDEGGSSSSSSSSWNSRASTSSGTGVGADILHQQASTPTAVDFDEVFDEASLQVQPLSCSHVCVVVVLLVLLLPVLWLVSEAVTEYLYTTTDCPAVLQAGGHTLPH